jgi:anti-sigma factor RsiW
MSLDREGRALVSYAVGALPDQERSALEAHLADCPECAAEARSLQRVTEALARAAPALTPRLELRARVRSIVERTPFPASGPAGRLPDARDHSVTATTDQGD